MKQIAVTVLALCLLYSSTAGAQTRRPTDPTAITAAGSLQPQLPDPKIADLTKRVELLERRSQKEVSGVLLFLFGAFCALWAQNTKRSPWVWFFAGLVFNVFAVLVLLSTNAQDLKGVPERKSQVWLLAGLAVVLVGLLLLFYLPAVLR